MIQTLSGSLGPVDTFTKIQQWGFFAGEERKLRLKILLASVCYFKVNTEKLRSFEIIYFTDLSFN